MGFVISLFLTIWVLGAGCGDSRRTESYAADSPTPVRHLAVSPVIKTDYRETYKTSGVIRSSYEAKISAEISGVIRKFSVEAGDRVSKGQVLVEIDPETFQLVVEEREAQLQEAKVAQLDAERNFNRARQLYEKSTVSESVYQSAEVALKAAEVKVKSAEIALKIARRDLSKTMVRAPESGSVLTKYGEAGEMIQPGQLLVHMGNYDRVEVEVGFSETQVIHLSLKQTVEVQIDSLPDKTFSGTITSIGIGSTEASGNFPVVVSLENPDRILLPGMIARVQVPGKVYPGILMVPQEAVRDRFGEHQVFVVEEGLARLRTVRIGRLMGEMVEIQSGVRAGDRVVTSGQSDLRDGEKIQPVPQGAPTGSQTGTPP